MRPIIFVRIASILYYQGITDKDPPVNAKEPELHIEKIVGCNALKIGDLEETYMIDLIVDLFAEIADFFITFWVCSFPIPSYSACKDCISAFLFDLRYDLLTLPYLQCLF